MRDGKSGGGGNSTGGEWGMVGDCVGTQMLIVQLLREKAIQSPGVKL